MNVKHDGFAYSPWIRHHAEATPGQLAAWRTVAPAGWSDATIARIWERSVDMVARELDNVEGTRGNRTPPLFARKYLARDIPEIPDNMQGLWEQFYQQSIRMYFLPAPVGGDAGTWLSWAKHELDGERLGSWMDEIKARYAMDGQICKWIKELRRTTTP